MIVDGQNIGCSREQVALLTAIFYLIAGSSFASPKLVEKILSVQGKKIKIMENNLCLNLAREVRSHCNNRIAIVDVKSSGDVKECPAIAFFMLEIDLSKAKCDPVGVHFIFNGDSQKFTLDQNTGY